MYSTYFPSAWHLVKFYHQWPCFIQVIYQRQLQPQSLHLSLFFSNSPPPPVPTPYKKTLFADLSFFTKHIHSRISSKYSTYKILQFRTPPYLQLHHSISSFSALKHTLHPTPSPQKHILSYILSQLHPSGLHIRERIRASAFHPLF